MKISKACLLIFISLVVFSCKKSDDDSVVLPTEPEKILSPEFTCTINGNLFKGSTVFSRYQSNRRLAISATNNQGSNLYFSIDYFVGNGIYPVSTYSFPDEEPIVKLRYITNSDTTYYRSKSYNYPNSGFVDVNSYSESPPVVGGSFYLTMVEVDNNQNEIEIESGMFSDILILPKLTSSEPGVITYWRDGKKFKSSLTEAILFDGLYMAMTFEEENNPNERFRYYNSLDTLFGESQNTYIGHHWYSDSNNQWGTSFFGDCNNLGFNNMLTISDNKLTGGSGSYGRDFEVFFQDIPFTDASANSVSNQLTVNTLGGLITFTQIDTFQFDLSGEYQQIDIRASNDLGQKLYVSTLNFFPFYLSYNDCIRSATTKVSIYESDGSLNSSSFIKCENIRDLNTGLAGIAGDGFNFISLTDFNPWIYGKNIPYTVVY